MTFCGKRTATIALVFCPGWNTFRFFKGAAARAKRGYDDAVLLKNHLTIFAQPTCQFFMPPK